VPTDGMEVSLNIVAFDSDFSRVGQSVRALTNRWSGRVIDKVPSSYTGARAAQLNR